MAKRVLDKFNLNSALLTMVLSLLVYIWSGVKGTIEGLVVGQANQAVAMAVMDGRVMGLEKHCLFKEDAPQLLRALQAGIRTDRRDDAHAAERFMQKPTSAN